MASSVRQFDAVADEERVLEIVRGLARELGHGGAIGSITAAARLDRDLGLGSLERVELLLRLEKTFRARLDEAVIAEAETVQDLISALSAANGTPIASSARSTSAEAERAPEISFTGRAQGVTAAETFQEVLRFRGRADAARTHLIFYQDEGESRSLTFGELLEGGERVAADLAQRGIGCGDSVALMLPTSREFFLVFAGTLLAGATPVPIYPPFRADRIAEYAERQ